MCAWFTHAGVVGEVYRLQFMSKREWVWVDTNYSKLCVCKCVRAESWEEVRQHLFGAEIISLFGLSNGRSFSPSINPLWYHWLVCGRLFWSAEFGIMDVPILFFLRQIWPYLRGWSWGGKALLHLHSDWIWLRMWHAVVVMSITR